MRAKAGDPPRTMSQKILASHCDGADGASTAAGRLIEVKVDQVVLAREPNRILASALQCGLNKSAVDVSVAYPSHCIAMRSNASDGSSVDRVPPEAIQLGFLIAQPGAGFAPAIHLERFASPARLVLTDEPRLASSGAAGMLTLPASRSQLSEALRTGTTSVRPAVSVQVLLSGRIRPFVSVRDVTLELLRRGLQDLIRHVDRKHRAPVVLEFGGPSCKFLSVGDRSILCAIAPQLGAAAALFGSDEKTETYLRDQRRSKAHRTLTADSGAPWEDVISIDLAAVDPLIQLEEGEIRPVRELEGKAVDQVLLGGDSGVSLRDFFAVSALLKSKRVSPGVDFLVCPPSRQMLEVLARGPLPELIATGARLLEPDKKILTGELYPPAGDGLSLKNCDHRTQASGAIVSPETLAYAVAHGELGDPRSFKRPVRVTVPRTLPTDDVLITRGKEARGGAKGKGRIDKRAADHAEEPPPSERFSLDGEIRRWSSAMELEVSSRRSKIPESCAFIAENLEDVRWLMENAAARPEVRAIIAEHIPAATVSVLSGLGVLALSADKKTLARVVDAGQLRVPEISAWNGETLDLGVGDSTISLHWLAVEDERKWTAGQ